jgi:hypothetical protein
MLPVATRSPRAEAKRHHHGRAIELDSSDAPSLAASGTGGEPVIAGFLRAGHHAIVRAVSQSAFVWPFAFGVLAPGERPDPRRWAGRGADVRLQRGGQQ